MHRPSRVLLIRVLAAGAVLLGFAGPAFAENDMTLAPSPALACLTIPGGASAKPEYPAASLARKDGGTVKVQLEFRAPGDKPHVTFLERAERDELNHAVAYHVQQFRVPCMQASNGPVTLVQAYVFDPDGASRVMAAPTRDTADIKREALLECIRHRDPDSKPRFPRQSDGGNLVVRYHFSARDRAPAVEFVGGDTGVKLRESIEDYAKGLRLPCLEDQPVDTMIAYIFSYGDGRRVLRDIGLAKLVGAARDLARPAYFNFDAMACPFDVRLTYHRPFASNKVQQLDTAVAARQPLLDWLEGVTFNLDEQKNASFFGSAMIVTVPCGKLDI